VPKTVFCKNIKIVVFLIFDGFGKAPRVQLFLQKLEKHMLLEFVMVVA
jgi:hypothetical protein